MRASPCLESLNRKDYTSHCEIPLQRHYIKPKFFGFWYPSFVNLKISPIFCRTFYYIAIIKKLSFPTFTMGDFSHFISNITEELEK